MDKKGIIIADTGPIISLAIIDKLHLLSELFDFVYIPKGVWIELTRNHLREDYSKIVAFFSNKIKNIDSFNNLVFVMDYGESEAIILYKELDANFLLIDDKKARSIAETLNVNCIGTIGLLVVAKEKGMLNEIRPLFKKWINSERFYSIKLLNKVLEKYGENEINF